MISILFVLCSIYSANAQWTTGKATMYGGNLNGNACGMSGTATAFSNWKYAAIGSSNFNSGYGCGNCYTIKATGAYGNNPDCKFSSKSITVQAIDECPECSKTHFDLNDDVMKYLTGSQSMAGTCGVISIKYKRVDCTAITSNFYVKNKAGTSKWWYGFHLNDVNDDGGIKSVQLLKNGKSFTSCKKNEKSFWICNNGGSISKSTPLDIKITSDKGKSVTAKNCITSFDGNKVMKCNTNLSKGGSSFTEEDDPASTSIVTGVIAIVLVTCIIIGIAGYCFIKRRRQKAKAAVSFKNSDGDDGTMQDEDGDNNVTTGTGGYDMSPIGNEGGDTPVSETPAGDDNEEIEIEVEAIEAVETQP